MVWLIVGFGLVMVFKDPALVAVSGFLPYLIGLVHWIKAKIRNRCAAIPL